MSLSSVSSSTGYGGVQAYSYEFNSDMLKRANDMRRQVASLERQQQESRVPVQEIGTVLDSSRLPPHLGQNINIVV